MKRVLIVAATVMFAIAAIGCKDKCIKACEHVAECLDGEKDQCTDKCKDSEDMDKKEAKEAAKCILDLSCDEIEERTEVVECVAEAQ